MSASDWIIIIGAVLTGVATIITAYAGLVKSKNEVRAEMDQECHEKLRAAYVESESAVEELHRIKMQGWPRPEES